MNRTIRSTLALIFLATLAAFAPAVAQAGTYTVEGICGNWDLAQSPAVAGEGNCNFLTLRNSVGVGTPPAAEGDQGAWNFDAPPGTKIVSYQGSATLTGGSNWSSSIVVAGADAGAGTGTLDCPGFICPGGFYRGIVDANIPGATRIAFRIRCVAAGGCDRSTQYSAVIGSIGRVTLQDLVAPNIAITGGSAASGGWISGNATVNYTANDTAGIKNVTAAIDGTLSDFARAGCNYSQKVPCPGDTSGGLSVRTGGLSDGSHQLVVSAIDSGDNGSSDTRTIKVDNSAPAAPISLTVNEGWQETNGFQVDVTAPEQTYAPVDALAVRLCPVGTPENEVKGCEPVVSSALEAIDPKNPKKGLRVKALNVPRPGAWQARMMLRDAAGNYSEANATTKTLHYDPDSPALTFLAQDPADPARLRVKAADSTSGIARAEIEVQKEGESTWRSLPVEGTDNGFRALLDDETLPKGAYALRARATDAAGNDATTSTRDDGGSAIMKIPVRLRSRLDVGIKGRKVCRGRGKRRSCKRRLRTKSAPNYGRRVRLYGRLMVGREPVRNTQVGVYQTAKSPGAGESYVKTITTSRTGRFSYRAPKGVARTVKFRYAGSNGVRGDNGLVALGVRGRTTFRPARRRVVNGETLTFRGRVSGRPLPPAGKLVELQVYTRRAWRTFAQPRSDAAGRWSYRYRFEQIQRTTGIRFRARLREEAGYPFDTGPSRARRIVVRGSR